MKRFCLNLRFLRELFLREGYTLFQGALIRVEVFAKILPVFENNVFYKSIVERWIICYKIAYVWKIALL